jgi:citrate lyase subunit beta/citryl-CoA lyase
LISKNLDGLIIAAIGGARCAGDGQIQWHGEARVAVRVHPVDHPSFGSDISLIVGSAHPKLRHVMVPKVETVADVDAAATALNQVGASNLPLHVLIESPAAVHHAFEIAAHPRVQSLSFGLMDFVSAHGGAIPSSGMGLLGQFTHPLVVRAKLEIASACHAHGKVPSHSVVTEFNDTQAMENAARKASQELGYTRMWSIHPAQIRPILAAMAPDDKDIETACAVLLAAQQAEWAPISHAGQLHDRASYRFFWHLLQRAQATGRKLPVEAQSFFA